MARSWPITADFSAASQPWTWPRPHSGAHFIIDSIKARVNVISSGVVEGRARCACNAPRRCGSRLPTRTGGRFVLVAGLRQDSAGIVVSLPFQPTHPPLKAPVRLVERFRLD